MISISIYIYSQAIIPKKDNNALRTHSFKLEVDGFYFPEPYYYIDSLLAEVINTSPLPIVDTVDGQMNLQIRSELVDKIVYAKIWTHYFEDSLFNKYLGNLNNYRTPFITEETKNRLITQFKVTKPGFIFLSKILFEKGYNKPAPTPLLVSNTYILIVEPVHKELKFIDEDLKFMRAYFYNCMVREDILNNYEENEIQLVANHLSKGILQMDIGKKYLVLIPLSDDSKHHGSVSLVRGWTTDGEGIFEIRDDNVIDTNHVFSNNNEIPIQILKDQLTNYISKKIKILSE